MLMRSSRRDQGHNPRANALQPARCTSAAGVAVADALTRRAIGPFQHGDVHHRAIPQPKHRGGNRGVRWMLCGPVPDDRHAADQTGPKTGSQGRWTGRPKMWPETA